MNYLEGEIFDALEKAKNEIETKVADCRNQEKMAKEKLSNNFKLWQIFRRIYLHSLLKRIRQKIKLNCELIDECRIAQQGIKEGNYSLVIPALEKLENYQNYLPISVPFLQNKMDELIKIQINPIL